MFTVAVVPTLTLPLAISGAVIFVCKISPHTVSEKLGLLDYENEITRKVITTQ